MLVLVHPLAVPLLHLLYLVVLMSCQHTWTVILSRIGEESFDILLWWRDHKLTYPILSIMARDIMFVPVSTVSSESCFSCTARILEDRRQRLLPEHVEMLTCIKDWDQSTRKEHHAPEDMDLEELFDNLYLDEGEGSGSGSGSTAAAAPGAG
jgi:hypothetical protein